MRTIIILIFATLALTFAANFLGTASTSKHRFDVQKSLELMNNELKKAKEKLPKETYQRVSKAISQFEKKEIEKQIKYIMRTYPFYDETRARAIVIAHQGLLVSYVVEAPQEQMEKNIKLLENNKIIDALVTSLALALETDYKTNFKSDEGLVNESFLYCSYDNYDTTREVASILSDVFLGSGGEKTGTALSLGSTISRETMTCRFRGDIKKYSTSYFYTSSFTGNKFFTKDKTLPITDKEYSNGINVASNTIKSNLDFVVIRLDIDIKGIIYQDIYAYQADRTSKQVFRIDSDTFLNEVAVQYKFEN